MNRYGINENELQSIVDKIKKEKISLWDLFFPICHQTKWNIKIFLLIK